VITNARGQLLRLTDVELTAWIFQDIDRTLIWLPTLDTLRNFLLAITGVELAVKFLPAKSRIEGDS
jgi:hypothetical protein